MVRGGRFRQPLHSRRRNQHDRPQGDVISGVNISRSILFGILVIGLALRLWAAFVVPPVEALNLIGDATAYDEIGRNIASGKGYAIGVPPVIRPTAQVAAPLYPMFLGCVYIAA